MARARELFVRPAIPMLVLLPLILSACMTGAVDPARMTLWDFIVAMFVFFLWFAYIWIFISIFGDIFRRDDIGGGTKAIWVFALIILPFLGALIYLVTRPKMTAGDVQRLTQMDAAVTAASNVTPADQIAKLQQLKASGAITEPEYEALKKQAMGGGS